MFAIEGVPRGYAWGSPTAIPELLGTPSDGTPVAELWFGTHVDSPSPIVGSDETLDEVVDLPFLLKLLAANKPLSIQVHPTIEQAEAGFAREEAADIPRDAPNRNYRDRNHKPELLAAITTFEALCGFRPVPQTLALLDAFALPELAEVRALLVDNVPSDGLRAAFTHLLRLDEPGPVVEAVVRRAAALAGDAHWAGAARAVALTAEEFPGDIGVVLTLLLNYVRLESGEAIFLGAGNVHCYLRGFGVEVMATSDNVLRCGLTPKHVDVDEVLAVADFVELPEPRCVDDGLGGHGHNYAVPVQDFGLFVVDLEARPRSAMFEVPGPFIVLCTLGTAEVARGDESITLRRGQAAFVQWDETLPLMAWGTGRLHVATMNWA